MNDDEDLTVIQTDADKRELEERILEERAENTPDIEMEKNDR